MAPFAKCQSSVHHQIWECDRHDGIVKVYDLVVAQTNGGPGIASEVPAKYVYDYMFQNQNLGQGFAASTMMLLSVLVIVVPWAILDFREQNEHG